MRSEKILKIDEKIQFLKKEKVRIKQNRLENLGRLLSRFDISEWDDNTLMGAFLFLKDSSTNNKEEWKKSGEKFLKDISKSSHKRKNVTQ